MFCETFFDFPLHRQIVLRDYNHQFFGSRHAKRPPDAEGTVIKTLVNRQITHNDSLIQSAEEIETIFSKNNVKNSPKCKENKKFKSQSAVILVQCAK